MKISAICFDLGKVLIDFDKESMLRRIAKKTTLSVDEITELIKHDEWQLAYELGNVSTADFLAHFKKLLRYNGPEAELGATFSEIFTPLPDNIALAALLAPHYPLGIISNTNDAHITHAEATYSFFSLFPVRIYSHQVQVMKPNPLIYQTALADLGGIDPLEALFIDDLEANVLGASRLGWQTIHLRPEVDLRQALTSYELMGLDI